MATLNSRSSVGVVLTAGELFCDYLIIARVAENRLWLKDSAHPDQETGQKHRSVDQRGLATFPRAQGPSVPSEPTFWTPSDVPFVGLCHSGHPLYFMHQFLAKEKWAEQTLSLLGLTVVTPTENAECDLV